MDVGACHRNTQITKPTRLGTAGALAQTPLTAGHEEEPFVSSRDFTTTARSTTTDHDSEKREDLMRQALKIAVCYEAVVLTTGWNGLQAA